MGILDNRPKLLNRKAFRRRGWTPRSGNTKLSALGYLTHTAPDYRNLRVFCKDLDFDSGSCSLRFVSEQTELEASVHPTEMTTRLPTRTQTKTP
ncbi:hypothetical protein GCM10027058_29300 [Microbacterium neimengense]